MRNNIAHIKGYFTSPWLKDQRTLLVLWLLVALIASLKKIHSHNNYSIFKCSFWHAWYGQNLYDWYPQEYGDIFHYGPLFTLLVAPFSLMPYEWMGILLWHVSLAMGLFYAIRSDVFSKQLHIFTLWFCAHELLTALFMSQYNVAVCAMTILAFAAVEKEKDCWAAMWIVIGTFTKLYGIVGVAFFFFSKHKVRFIAWLMAWSIVAFVLPMFVFSPQYILDQYVLWFEDLKGKNSDNSMALMQNISLLGIIRKTGFYTTGNVWWIHTYSDLYTILVGMLLMAVGYFRISQWKNQMFRMQILAAVLMFIVLFSTGSESSSYIIALTGCCIWYVCVPWQRNQWDVALMVFAFILTSMSPSDLFPAYIRNTWVHPYALKALPVTLIWIKLSYEIITKKYDTVKL